MFRESYRRRSAITWSVWCGAFAVLSVFLAWRLEWLPGSGNDNPVEELSPLENGVAEGAPAAKTAPVDPALLAQQGEPGDEFSEPSRFRGQPGARPIAGANHGGLSLAGGTTDSKKSRTPSFLEDFAPDGKSTGGVRPAGFRPPATRDASAPPATLLSEIDGLIQKREYLAAHRKLSDIYWNKPHWRSAIKTRIEMTAEVIYFKLGYDPLPAYTVKYGDHLETIAKRYGVDWRYLARLNELRIVKTSGGQETVNIQPGQKLKVIKGVATRTIDGRRYRVPLFRVSIDLGDRELTLHHDGFFVRKYRIGIGRENRTPKGRFAIKEKVIDPPYDGKDERSGRNIHFDGNDPRNPLGCRWLGIGNSCGIHGTIDPNSIGKAESRGCIRMHNSDVKEVYGFLAIGSEVEIRP